MTAVQAGFLDVHDRNLERSLFPARSFSRPFLTRGRLSTPSSSVNTPSRTAIAGSRCSATTPDFFGWPYLRLLGLSRSIQWEPAAISPMRSDRGAIGPLHCALLIFSGACGFDQHGERHALLSADGIQPPARQLRRRLPPRPRADWRVPSVPSGPRDLAPPDDGARFPATQSTTSLKPTEQATRLNSRNVHLKHPASVMIRLSISYGTETP